MYEKLKNYIQTHFAVLYNFGVLLVLLFLFMLCRAASVGNSVDAELQQADKLSTKAGQSVRDAVKQNSDAKADISATIGSVDRVSDRIESSKGTAQSINDEINELSGIVEQCRKRNLRIKSILEQVEK